VENPDPQIQKPPIPLVASTDGPKAPNFKLWEHTALPSVRCERVPVNLISTFQLLYISVVRFQRLCGTFRNNEEVNDLTKDIPEFYTSGVCSSTHLMTTCSHSNAPENSVAKSVDLLKPNKIARFGQLIYTNFSYLFLRLQNNDASTTEFHGENIPFTSLQDERPQPWFSG
jgi:hypothetical protein